MEEVFVYILKKSPCSILSLKFSALFWFGKGIAKECEKLLLGVYYQLPDNENQQSQWKKVIHGFGSRVSFSHGKTCKRRTKGKQSARFLRWLQWGWQMNRVIFHFPPLLNNQGIWPLYLVRCHRESGVFFSRISSSLQGFLHWLLRKTKAQGKAGYQCHSQQTEEPAGSC